MKKILFSCILPILMALSAANDNLAVMRIYNSYSNTIPINYRVDGGNWTKIVGYGTTNFTTDQQWTSLPIAKNFDLTTDDNHYSVSLINTQQYLNSQLVILMIQAIKVWQRINSCILLSPNTYGTPLSIAVYPDAIQVIFYDTVRFTTQSSVRLSDSDPICAKFFAPHLKKYTK